MSNQASNSGSEASSGCRPRHAHGLLSSLFEHLPDPIYVIDPPSARIVACNRAGHDQFGFSREELLDRTVMHLQEDLADHGHWQRVAGAIRRSGSYVFVGRHRHRAGHHVPVEVHSRIFLHREREYFLSVARQVGAEPGEHRSHDMLGRDAQVRFALNDAVDGLWDWNIRSNEVYFSPQWKRLLGYGPDGDQPSVDLWTRSMHPDDKPRVQHALKEHLSGRRERFEAEYRLRNRNGHYVWVHDRAKVCERDADGRPLRMVGMTHDVTERKHLELELQRRATRDALTGLLNRRESEIVLPTQLQLCRRLGVGLSVCLFDIDHFKCVNDLYGHLSGDLVLQRIGELVESAVRAADYLFRWGGEEFLLVCADTDSAAMGALAEKLRERIEAIEWPAIDGLERVTASFGVASYPRHEGVNELLLAADSALYRAKLNGRNRVEVEASDEAD